MFDRQKRDVKLSKNPGPGSYFQAGYTCASAKKDVYTFSRGQRILMGDKTKPDYDMSVFYADKGPGVKPKMGGYTISNTGGVDATDNPSAVNNPGVGQYETKHGYVKTTAFKNV